MQTSKQTQPENVNRYQELLNAPDRADLFFLEEEDTDMLVERLFDSMHSSPLGRLLSIISALPEVRVEKVERARRQIDQPEECWDARMDMALDRVLEELIIGD
ncbi:MAG: hypothetical protein ABFR90_02945 [Planctomycetota bacterium]